MTSRSRHLELGGHRDRPDLLVRHALVSGVGITIRTQALAQAVADRLNRLWDPSGGRDDAIRSILAAGVGDRILVSGRLAFVSCQS